MRNDNHIIKLGRGKKWFLGIAEESFFTTTQPQLFCHSERSEESISNLPLTLQFISDIRQRREEPQRGDMFVNTPPNKIQLLKTNPRDSCFLY